MEQGIDTFLSKLMGKVIVVITVAAEQSKVTGTLEAVQTDCIVVNDVHNGNPICIRKEAIVTIQKSGGRASD